MRFRSIVVATFLVLIACQCRAEEFAELAKALRTAMAQRDLPGAKTKLEELKAAATTEEQQVEADRLDLLYGYLFDFWKSVHAGGQKLLGAEEIVIGGKQVAVVEYDAAVGKLVLRVEGENKRYTLFDMPPRVAMTLSEQVLKKGAPENEAYLGTFLAMDAKGDRKLARDAWQRAQQGGVDVKTLLPELGVDLPAAAKIELPKLTPQTAGLLRPQFWQLALQDDKGWKRSPLAKFGAQQATGRLEIAVPDNVDAAWLTFGRKMPVNFGVRLYFVGLPAGQKFGFFNDKTDGLADAYVELPEGTVKVEFARRSGELICRINDEETKVTIIDAEAIKAGGMIGLSTSPGAKLTVAGCEVSQ